MKVRNPVAGDAPGQNIRSLVWAIEGLRCPVNTHVELSGRLWGHEYEVQSRSPGWRYKFAVRLFVWVLVSVGFMSYGEHFKNVILKHF